MPTILLLLLTFLGTQIARGAVLTVPGQYPGIQAAMDASAPGDTVHVAPGTWYGLYTSPTHSLTLCSNYLFTQDSTDINETILDGEYAGTILDLVCENEWFTLCGFTMQHGLGQQLSNGSYCDRGGALQISPMVYTEIRDLVFRENRAPRRGAVLFRAEICVGNVESGDMILRNIACYNNATDTHNNPSSSVILIESEGSNLLIDGLYYDGGGDDSRPFRSYSTGMQSIQVNNITVVNSMGGFSFLGHVAVAGGPLCFTNLRSTGAQGINEGSFGISVWYEAPLLDTVVIHDVLLSGLVDPSRFAVYTNRSPADIRNITIEHCRFIDMESNAVDFQSDLPVVSTLRNLYLHHNTCGDSISHVAESLFQMRNFNLDSAWVHDNRSIVPAHPSPSTSGGNSVDAALLYLLGDSDYCVRNLVFENNRIDDLDDYSNHSPSVAYQNNEWRDLSAHNSSGTLTASNIRVRNSRQPNHCPEVYSVAGIDLARPGSTIGIKGIDKVVVDNIQIEDSDDGGLQITADSVFASNIFLRNVGRMAFKGGNRGFPTTFPYAIFRNILVDNVDASDNYLPVQYEHLSNQTVVFTGLSGGFNGVAPTLVFENMTVTGCDGMRHLFNFYNAVNLQFTSCLFFGNNYEQLVEWDDPISQTWEYSIVEETVPGIGNQIGIDPWFDEELGAPWLSPLSPAIDAGHPHLVYNDIEDPDNPGFALWPSQGTLRNDTGYTGGPNLIALDTSWVALNRHEPGPVTQPRGFSLNPASPNPFNPTTTLTYSLDHPMPIELSVYNLLGQQVRTLAFGLQETGEHSVPFTAGELASGVYVVELKAGAQSQTQKILLLK